METIEMKKHTNTFFALLLCLGVNAAAEILPGHSYHGEAFDEGPRQAAFLMDGTPNVNFPVTCDNEEAQAFFNQGIGQLHGFWYFEAERSFRQALALDETCVMAYWGMAMSNPNNKKRARSFISNAKKKAKDLTKREKMYIDATARFLEEDKRSDKERQIEVNGDFQKIMEAFPDDLEAKAFWAVKRWKHRSKDRIKKKEDVDKVVKEVHAKNPLHPAHHYRVHLWDSSGLATNALDSAASIGKSGPAIAHLWHMAGHTYSRLYRFSDAAWQQEASARTDHGYMIKNHVLPDQIHNFAHNNEWLIRNLNNIGSASRAVSLAKNMVELPRHPKYNTFKKGSANYGYARMMETMVRYEMWNDLAELSKTHYLTKTDNKNQEMRRHHALALAYYNLGDTKKAAKELAAVQVLHAAEEKRKKDEAAAKKKREEEAKKKREAEAKKAGEKKEDGLKTKAPAKKKSSSRRPPRSGYLSTLANASMAIQELGVHRYLAEGKTKEALAELGRAKRMDPVRRSWLYDLAGDREEAIKVSKAGLARKKGQVVPLANYTRLLWRDGQEEAAIEQFKKMRKLAAEADLRAPIFRELAVVAIEAGFEEDWRPKLQRKSDFGQRPDLDSLGPFRWTAPKAQGWSLPDANDKQVSLSDYDNRAVIVIFYLGSGCTHCIEQLSVFAPLSDEFKKLGVSLVGIGTDDRKGLVKSAKLAADKGGFPFPLLADPDMNVFRKYRAYDDFEKMPLHGTFLISPNGKVLWQDISFEPFTETEFLLNEAERLLGLEAPASLATAK
ncbi:MAG: alkyl hydroperoxide reductase [Verrucomicrobiales bacterium]|nr:alkyl hydroperoxide reductase [Verrucomicrobiales bacterium]